MENIRLAVVGGGNMSRAILLGAVRNGSIGAGEILVADPDPAARDAIARLGVQVVERAKEFAGRLAGDARIMLAVKPQMLGAATADLGDAARSRCVISILAGSTITRIRESLGGDVRVVRTMPNLPARIGKGITALAFGADATDDDREFTRALFAGVGETIELGETLIDAFTAIAGSGPAYVFYLAEAMRDAGAGIGFSREESLRIVRATILGAGTLLGQSDEDPADLRASVTSRKGTTDAAINVMESSGVRDAIRRAMIAARDRGAELAML